MESPAKPSDPTDADRGREKSSTYGVSSSERNGEPSVAQVYTSVPTMSTPSAANTALHATRDPCAAMITAREETAAELVRGRIVAGGAK